TLKGMTWDHPRGYQPLIACSDEYEKQHGVRITWDKRSLKAFGDQPINELTAEYDMIIIDHPHVGIAAATGALIPLDDYLPEDTLTTLAQQSAGPSHQSYAYDGHQWGLAVDAAMQTAVYRPDLFDERDLPQSWTDFLTLLAAYKDHERYIAMPLAPTDCMCSFISLCASSGEPIGQNANLISDETGLAGLNTLKAIKDAGHPNCLEWNPIHMLDHMSTHDDVVYCPLTFCYTNYSRKGYQPHLLTFTNIPGVHGSILGGTGFAVSSSSAHVEAAADFGAWLCGADTQRSLYVQQGGQPGNIIAWQDDNANALTNNFFANTLSTLEQSEIRPRHHGFTEFQEQAGVIIHDFLRKDTRPADCLHDLRTRYAEYAPREDAS
ncbi:MAG: extracellular solute-binding protein, partial [Chloroflexota bacterium]